MKIKFIVVYCAVVVSLMVSVAVANAQNANCIITEKQGSLATVSCPGTGTQTQNLGGAADKYKIGDTIAVPSASQDRTNRQSQSSTVDPRSGRR